MIAAELPALLLAGAALLIGVAFMALAVMIVKRMRQVVRGAESAAAAIVRVQEQMAAGPPPPPPPPPPSPPAAD